MLSLTLRSLGQAEVLQNGQPVKWGAESARNLVFFLLALPGGCGRDEIIDTLWQEDPDTRSNNRFRVALHRARAALGGPDSILEEDGHYRLADGCLRASDVYALYAALEEADHATGPARLLALSRAIGAYSGDFLPQVEADWVRQAREEHRAAYTRAVIERSLVYCEQVRCDLAVRDLSTALRADPFLGENYHQKLMTCLSVVEGKYAATEHYRRFVRFLHDDLNDTPMPETVELAERIKRGERICLHAEGREAPRELPLSHNCPLTGDGHCPGHYARLLPHD